MKSILISIIIPTFNRANLISDTLNSIINQTYSNLEILVIDDHSTDNTESIVNNLIKNDNRIQYYKRPLSKPKGANACRNYGFSIAKGEYIKWIDSDDTLAQDAIQKQVSAIVVSGTDVCICQVKTFISKNNNIEFFHEWGNINHEPSPESFILNGFKWGTLSGLWRRSWFQNNYIWDEEIMNSQDWLMNFTALSQGVKISKVFEFLAFVRIHNNNMSNANLKRGMYYYHECLARLKAFKIANLYGVTQPKIIKKIARQFNWYYLFIYLKGAPILGFRLFFNFIKFIIIYLK